MESPSTPSRRIIQPSPTTLVRRPHYIKTNVDLASPDQCQCILTRLDYKGLVLLCQVFRRKNSKNNEIMSNIEYQWNMPFETLNLDSRYNYFNCKLSFCDMFAGGLWCVMPELEAMEIYLRTTRDNIQEIFKLDQDKGVHKYTFLALDKLMKKVLIARREEDAPNGDYEFSTHFYPFNGPISQMQSHLHPKFAILHIGQMLHEGSLEPGFREEPHIVPYKKHFSIIEELYARWTSSPTPTERLSHPVAPLETFDDNDDEGHAGQSYLANEPAQKDEAHHSESLETVAAAAETSTLNATPTVSTTVSRKRSVDDAGDSEGSSLPRKSEGSSSSASIESPGHRVKRSKRSANV